MEYFRWILVAIGLLILLGIVLFANPERKQSMTRSKKKDSKTTTQRQEPVLDMHDEELYLARQQTIAGLNVDKAPSDVDAVAEPSDKTAQRDERPSASAAASDTRRQSASDTRPQPAPAAVSGRGQGDERAHARANAHSGTNDSIEQLFKNNVFSLYIVAERREPIAGVELLNAAVKIGLDFGEHGIFHRVHPESGESIFSMANLTAPGSFDPTAWNLFETRGVSLFMPLPGPLGAMNGWDTMLASAERLSSLLSARIVNARREPLSRQQVAQIREQMRQFDRRRQ